MLVAVAVEVYVERDVDVAVAVAAGVTSAVLADAFAVLSEVIEDGKVVEPAVMLTSVDS